jgi:hypothetical protein
VTARLGVDEHALDECGALAGFPVGCDPGRQRARVAQDVVSETQLPLAGIVIELEALAATGKVVEDAFLLRLADEAFGDRLPGGSDAVATLRIPPDGRAARFGSTGQWAGAACVPCCRWLPQMGQVRSPDGSRDMKVAHPLVVHRSRRPAARSAAERRSRRWATARCPSAVVVERVRVHIALYFLGALADMLPGRRLWVVPLDGRESRPERRSSWSPRGAGADQRLLGPALVCVRPQQR